MTTDLDICLYDHPSGSLARAVCAIGRSGGHEIDISDLNHAMGLSWMDCTLPGESNRSDAWMYARDAFLIPAGRLFGLNIREMHPPRAAVGLDRASEFTQHFDASYRPLIHRALENGQQVLAWRGWPGNWKLWWGIISETCSEGIGFRGKLYPSPDLSIVESHVLPTPPTQLYVVETIAPRRPTKQELNDLVAEHRRIVQSGGLDERFNVSVRAADFGGS